MRGSRENCSKLTIVLLGFAEPSRTLGPKFFCFSFSLFFCFCGEPFAHGNSGPV
jgi:hypothetical protein